MMADTTHDLWSEDTLVRLLCGVFSMMEITCNGIRIPHRHNLEPIDQCAEYFHVAVLNTDD